MSLPLTPQILEAAYEYLRACPPFDTWKLPPGEEIEFNVIGLSDREGHYTRYCRTEDHIIAVSQKRIGHTNSLMCVIAHELIHLKQAIDKTETKNMHNADFRKWAGVVCHLHGWDERQFV